MNRSSDDWLRLIRDAAADSGRVRLTRHARERMAERGVVMREVLDALRRGTFDEEPAPATNPPGHWAARLSTREGIALVVGLDPDGEPVVLRRHGDERGVTMYQYAECGLPYIYLAGGYRLENGSYGETLAIEDVDALHRAITRWIAENLDRLRGREVRFLRLELGLTQVGLAAELAVTDQTVSLWERQPDKEIPKPSDRLLRLIAEAWLDDHQSIAGAFARVRQTSGHAGVERQPFRRVASCWQAAA